MDRANAILRRPAVEIPAVGYDMLPGAGKSYSGHYQYCVFCGYRREDPMHIVYEKGFIPFEASSFSFASTTRPSKYGDWLHLELLFHEGDFACYTVREVTKESSVFVLTKTEKDAEIEVTLRGEIKRVKIASCEALKKISVGILPNGEDTAVKIKAVQGDVVLRSVIFE